MCIRLCLKKIENERKGSMENHSLETITNNSFLLATFFFLYPISLHRLYGKIALLTLSSKGRASDRGFGPR